MMMISGYAGDDPKGPFYAVEIRNVGKQPTTVLGVGVQTRSKFPKNMFKNQARGFVIPDPLHGSLPKKLEPGERYQFFTDQKKWDAEIRETEKATFWISHTFRDKPLKVPFPN